jgi:hypothetical protein
MKNKKKNNFKFIKIEKKINIFKVYLLFFLNFIISKEKTNYKLI